MKPRHWICLIVGLASLYPLSWGPVYALTGKISVDSPINSAVLRFYRPLFWVFDRSETFDEAMAWYTRLWVPSKRGAPSQSAPPPVELDPSLVESSPPPEGSEREIPGVRPP